MYKEGVLDSKQMGGAFTMLRAHDLLWQPAVKSYLKGERDGMIDLMAWNADGTRMPWKMHTEYLIGLYLRNDLAEGRFKVEGETISLKDIRVPMFVVGTETDHVAPWKSAYKVSGLTSSPEFTFLLTSGGHNAGIISGPVHPSGDIACARRKRAKRHFRQMSGSHKPKRSLDRGGQSGRTGSSRIESRLGAAARNGRAGSGLQAACRRAG